MEMPDKLVIEQLRNQIKGLQYDCAELQKKNDELAERCKKLASRQPTFPKGIHQEGIHRNINIHENDSLRQRKVTPEMEFE